MLHKHHIIPRHAGGSNDLSNIQVLTVEEHVEAHKKLYQEFGRWQDDLAARFLSGIVSKKEAVIELLSVGGRIGGSRPKSDIHRKRIGQSKIGKPRPWTEEWKKNISSSLKGREISWTAEISAATRGVPKKKYLCSCGKNADMANLKRWHPTHKVVTNG
jgi:hypothetical protein